jgi:hypothetical protein
MQTKTKRIGRSFKRASGVGCWLLLVKMIWRRFAIIEVREKEKKERKKRGLM